MKRFTLYMLIFSLIFWSCTNDDDCTEPTPVNNEPYLVEIDTFGMAVHGINSNYPCNNFVYFRNFARGYFFRINNHPTNFDPNDEQIFYRGIFRVFPDSTIDCTNNALDPPPTDSYINVDLLYFSAL